MTAIAPPLPEGWLWLFGEADKRWRFIHSDTEHKQIHFPRSGDELVASKATYAPLAHSDLLPESTVSTTSIVALQETNKIDGISQVSASVAAVTVEQPLGPNRDGARSLRRKPVAKRTVPGSPLTPAIVNKPLVAEKQHENKNNVHPSLQEPTGEAPQYQRQPSAALEISAIGALDKNQNSTATDEVSGAPLQPWSETVADSSVVQDFMPLESVQTAPATGPELEQHRPQLATIHSAPKILQADNIHTAATSSASEQLKSRFSRMSKGVGDWAKKHPKMTMGSAVMVEIAGLAAGVDVVKDARAVQRMKQTVKQGMGARPTNTLAAGNASTAKLTQQFAQHAALQQSPIQQSQQMLQQILQQQMSQGQTLQNQPLPTGYAYSAAPFFDSPQIPAGNFANHHQPPSQMSQQQQSSGQQTGQAQQSSTSAAGGVNNGYSVGPDSQFPLQQQVPAQHTGTQAQGTSNQLHELVSKISGAYHDHQANQAVQQQHQAAYQQQLSGQPQQSPVIFNGLANNLANAHQNNQASQQQAADQQQLAQQQIAYFQQQNAAQQQAYQVQVAQLNQQATLYQNPYTLQQQPTYIDTSSSGSGDLADALASATLSNLSSSNNPLAVNTTSTADSTVLQDPTAALQVDPIAEQTMAEDDISIADQSIWMSMNDAAIL